MTFIINILVFALVMGTIVLVHELGHLIAAKSFGVYCREFAIGMGPKIYSYQSKKSETAYSIRALPIGGYVAMAGEPGEEGLEDVPLEKTIQGISRWKRLIVLLAGVFMNMVLAFIVYVSLFGFLGVVRQPEPIIAAVADGYPAQAAGLQADDEIVKMTFYNGTVIVPENFTDVSMGIITFEDNPIEIEFLRGEENLSVTVTPVFNEDSESYVLGIQAYPGAIEKIGLVGTIVYTFQYLVNMVGQIIMVLGLLIRGIGLNNVGGPVAIFQATSQATVSGFDFIYLWNLIGGLSVSLAVMNLVPIPIFDGGRALLTVIEMIIRRPIPKKFENAIMMIGLALAILIMVFFVINDFKRL